MLLTTLLPLLGILLTAIACAVLSRNALRQADGVARAVVVAAGQRPLADRMVRTADAVASGRLDRAAGSAALLSDASSMELTQRHLLYGDAASGLRAVSTGLVRGVYFAPPVRLRSQVSQFLGHARSFAAATDAAAANGELAAMREAVDGPLGSGLDAGVDAFHAAGQRQALRLRRILAVGVSLVCCFAAGGLFGFPAMRRRMPRVERGVGQESGADVLSRRALLTDAERELTRAARTQRPVCLVVAEIDGLRAIGDSYGKGVRDRVAGHFCAVARGYLRTGDLLGQMEEGRYALLLSGTDLDGGKLAANRLRERFRGTTAALTSQSRRLAATVSLAVTCGYGESLQTLMATADSLLQQAQSSGGDRVQAANCDAVTGAD